MNYPITDSLGLLAPTGDNALFPGLDQGPDSLGSVLGLRWNCDFNHLVALRENGRVTVDLGESITDAGKKKSRQNKNQPEHSSGSILSSIIQHPECAS